MEKFLLDAFESLGKAKREDPRYKELQEAEEAALSSTEVRALHEIMEGYADAYQRLLSYEKPNSPEALALSKKLSEAKMALDAHPLMVRYNHAYIVVKDLERAMDAILFLPYRERVLQVEDIDA